MNLLKILLSGIVISFAWPVRGQFGHEWGAMIPGALAAFITSFISQTNWRQVFAQAVIFSSIGFAIGGDFGYGSLVDSIVAADSLKDVIPQLIEVFFIGAIWGALGMTFLGFAVAELEILIQDLAVLLGAGIVSYLAADLLKQDAQNLYWYAASVAVIQIYNSTFRKSNMVTLFGTYGFLGFGFGFLIAVLILWFGTHDNWPGTWWSLRDQIWGFIGGVSVILACFAAIKKEYVPVPMKNINWQRAGFIVFVSVVTGWNTYNVYTKWFQSTPVVSNPAFWGAFLIGCFLLLAALLVYFLRCAADTFQTKLNQTLLWTSLFFCWYVAILAILKSIVYSGWSVWETAFTLFLIDCVIFSVTLPFILNAVGSKR